eukprot:CAMPEP_0206182876 /NCGR_PEP_ID=MMETSP0166-20121206/311_1 /ASSEMBLY_ACC=CAM_ASM_000260 /TAXON_ID=95228 /ORGANISM="Vannella robusta, Strain DIVA3 518/3/11/1/6" /LENGTH=251 /DNA_ID=CAMNT_0053597639 /DNA_START=363 /DNA_END=1118 /DNA_ORIENTATION=+
MPFDGEEDPYPANCPFGSPKPLEGLPPMEDPSLSISLHCPGISLVEIDAGDIWVFGLGNLTGKREELGDQPIPVPLGNLGQASGQVRSLSSDGSTFYITDNLGEVWYYKKVWDFENLGKEDPLALTRIQGIPEMRKVVCAGLVTLYLDMENNVWVSGISRSGALGLGDVFRQEEPRMNPAFGKAVDIFGCYNCSGCINEDGEIFVCGSNSSGTLGFKSSVRDVFSPVQIKEAPKPTRKPEKIFKKSARSTK